MLFYQPSEQLLVTIIKFLVSTLSFLTINEFLEQDSFSFAEDVSSFFLNISEVVLLSKVYSSIFL